MIPCTGMPRLAKKPATSCPARVLSMPMKGWSGSSGARRLTNNNGSWSRVIAASTGLATAPRKTVARQLGAHFQQVFVLDFGTVVGVADDHDEALTPEGTTSTEAAMAAIAGLARLATSSATRRLCRTRRARPTLTRTVARSAIARRTCSVVVAEALLAMPFMTRETVAIETPACCATVAMGLRRVARGGWWLGHGGWSCIGGWKTIGFRKTFTQWEEFGRWLAGEIF